MKCPHCGKDDKRAPSTSARLERSQERRNEAQDEIYRLIRGLCAAWPSHVCRAVKGTKRETDWHYVICIHAPAGQMAWRASQEVVDKHFADMLPADENDWDQHTTLEKWQRLSELPIIRLHTK